MENANTNLQEEPADKIYDYAAELLINQQKPPTHVKLELIRKGLSESEATIVVDRLYEKVIQEKKKRAKKEMLFGGLWFFGGLIITVLTMSMVSSGGGRYIVAWGAVVFGAVQFSRGLANFVKAK